MNCVLELADGINRLAPHTQVCEATKNFIIG